MLTNTLEGCSFSELWVSPKDWKTNTDLSLDWRVECRFYDPNESKKYPKGFLFRRRVNRPKTLIARREAVTLLLRDIPLLFKHEGFNPITGKFMRAPLDPQMNNINPDMGMISAFQAVSGLIPGSAKHIGQARIVANRFEKQVRKMRLSHLTINELNYATFYSILEAFNMKNTYYNRTRMYFMAMFKVLLKNHCCKENLAGMLDKRVEVKTIRKILEMNQIDAILEFLEENYYEFHRYAKIFFYSGTRSTELLSIQRKHVRLDQQEYDVLIKKRANSYSWETKVILKDSIPYWTELLELSKNGEDFIFSKNLRPGPVQISPAQISRRWKNHVKDKLTFYNDELCLIKDLKKQGLSIFTAIDEDFYSLKHSFLDHLDAQQTSAKINSNGMLNLINSLDIDNLTKAKLLAELAGPSFDIARNMAAHQSSTITDRVYKINKKKRENEYLKNIKL